MPANTCAPATPAREAAADEVAESIAYRFSLHGEGANYELYLDIRSALEEAERRGMQGCIEVAEYYVPFEGNTAARIAADIRARMGGEE